MDSVLDVQAQSRRVLYGQRSEFVDAGGQGVDLGPQVGDGLARVPVSLSFVAPRPSGHRRDLADHLREQATTQRYDRCSKYVCRSGSASNTANTSLEVIRPPSDSVIADFISAEHLFAGPGGMSTPGAH